MKFIRMPKAIYIAERVLPELLADWMNTKSVQNINITFVQKLRVNILICLFIKWSISGMSHRRTFTNFTYRAWTIWDYSNHDLFGIIPNPGCQTKITVSLESVGRMRFQAGTSYVKIREWGQHGSNRRMPCPVTILGSVWGQGISETRIQARFLVVQWIFFQISPIVRCSSQGCWSPEKLVNLVLSDAHMTGTIVAPAGHWSCASHHQSAVFISLYIRWFSDCARRTSSKLRCAWNGRCAEWNCIHLKISL